MQRHVLSLLAAAMLCWLVAAPSWAAENPSGPSEESEEQQPKNNTGQASVDYSATYSSSGCTMMGNIQVCTDKSSTQQFSGSVTLKRTEEDDEYEGFHGEGTASYSFTGGTDTKPHDGCPAGAGDYTEVTGTVTLTVNAACTLNGMTSGADTSMYDYETTNVEAVIEAYDLHFESKWHHCNGHRDSMSHDEAAAGTGCYFYNVDFDNGGTYKYAGEEARDTPFVCTMTITLPPGPKLRVYGTVMGQGDHLPDLKGPFPISNAQVVAMKSDEPRMEKLSESRPLFAWKTTSSDDEQAEYEIELPLPCDPPRVVVASTLWHAGSPEFAVTAAQNPDGTYIPVYQALCVDDNPTTKCEKWVKTSDGGFEARVNFIHGDEQKRADHQEIMPEESWDGPLPTLDKISESAFVYYHSYRAFKYFQTLGLQVPWNELLIRLWHDEDDCLEKPDTAYYDAPAFLASKPRQSAGILVSGDTSAIPSFGDLGRHLEAKQATGAGVYGCTANRFADNYSPEMPLWHELGHYLHFQMYDAYDYKGGKSHQGYKNPTSSDSVIEGFASFVAMLTNEYYGESSPQVLYGQNLELDFKVWGLQGVWGQSPYDEGFEEDAVTGILWDLHDSGHEINFGQSVNGQLVPVSRVYPVSEDKVALSASKILNVIHRSRPRTLVQLHGGLYDMQVIPERDLDMIFVNHGAFADIAVPSARNYVHDSDDEFVAQTGSSVEPERLVRHTPPPGLPGSNLVSTDSSTYLVTVSFDEPYQTYSYEYPLTMEAGISVAFRVPPPYYSFNVKFFPLTDGDKGASPVLEFSSDEYWEYMRSGPEESAVFKRIPGGDIN